MLKNEYLVPKIGIGTAENEPPEVCRCMHHPRSKVPLGITPSRFFNGYSRFIRLARSALPHSLLRALSRFLFRALPRFLVCALSRIII